MTPLLTKEDDPIETPPPKMNAVLLTFFSYAYQVM